MRRRSVEEQNAFVVIVGASGSGKSSLARAGVAADLMQFNLDDSIRAWRYASFWPGSSQGDWFGGLVRALMDVKALPELEESSVRSEVLAADLAAAPQLTVRQTFGPAFSRRRESGGPVRLLLLLDQMEELWTDSHRTAQDRESFLSAVEALALGGSVWVVATLRSDFYPQAQQCDAFLRLKGTNGQYDLRPPTPAAWLKSSLNRRG